MNVSKYRIPAVLCCVALIAISSLSLLLAEADPDFGQTADWRAYGIQICLMLVSGLLLREVYRKWRKEEKDVWMVLSGVAAVALAYVSLTVQYSYWKAALQQLLIGLWPLLLWLLLHLLREKEIWYGYYGIVGAMSWVLLDLLAPGPHWRWEPVTLMYLVISAVLAWNCYDVSFRKLMERHGDRWFRRSAYMLRKVLSWLPVALAAVLLICFQDRINFIVMSLGRPLSSSGTELWEVNWLSHRLRMMAVWLGDTTRLEPYLLPGLPVRAPLLVISETLSPYMLLLVIGTLVLLLWLLWNIPRSSVCRPLCGSRVLIWAFLTQSVLGLASELMVNTTTMMSIPFLRSAAGFWLLPLALDVDVYDPGLFEEMADHVMEQLNTLLEEKGLKEKSRTGRKERWYFYCPPVEPWKFWRLHSDWDWSEGFLPEGYLDLHWENTCADPPEIRVPEPVTKVYEKFPIEAAGKKYHALDQLCCESKHVCLSKDIYGREVFRMCERANPCFDEFDVMYDDSFIRHYFLREDDKLTWVRYMDGDEEITVTEDVGTIRAELWNEMLESRYFEEGN